MNKEKRDSKPRNIQINKYFNSESYLNELPKIYENEFIIIFNDILNISKKEFFENISSRVKNLINEKYKIEINNNEKLQTSLNTYFHQYEQKYNLYLEEICQFLEEHKKNQNNGFKDELIVHFRKHCGKTDNFAIHNCNQKNKIGAFLPIYERFVQKKSNYLQYKSANVSLQEETKPIKYVICFDCHKVFFSNKFLGYCKYCEIDFYSYILIHNENENLLPSKWENDHCEFLINQQIKCPQCNGLFYIDIKYNILKCPKCKIYKSPKNIERICNICKFKFVSDILIFNPLEKDQLNDTINNAIISKNKAHPIKIPCCTNINIFTTDFHHNNICKGLLYLLKFQKKLLIFCLECKKVFNYDKFIWTCPSCNEEFKGERYHSKNASFLLKNDFEIKNNNYGKNSINSNIDSSRRMIYDKNSLNSFKYAKNDQKSDSNIISDLKKNLNSDKKLDKNNYNTNSNKKEFVDRLKNEYNIELNNSKNYKYSAQNTSQNIANINRRHIYINNIYNNSIENESQNFEKIFGCNKSEANLFEYKINKERKISAKNSEIISIYNNIPIQSSSRQIFNIKSEENEKNQEKNKKNHIIFKRNNFNIKEEKKKNNMFNLFINTNSRRNYDKDKNNMTIFNIYNKNIPSASHISSSYLLQNSKLNISKNLGTEIEEEKKKGEKKIILKSKNIFSNRLSRENNPFIKKISPKLNLHNYLIKNFSSSSIKEESKLEEKEKGKEKGKEKEKEKEKEKAYEIKRIVGVKKDKKYIISKKERKIDENKNENKKEERKIAENKNENKKEEKNEEKSITDIKIKKVKIIKNDDKKYLINKKEGEKISRNKKEDKKDIINKKDYYKYIINKKGDKKEIINRKEDKKDIINRKEDKKDIINRKEDKIDVIKIKEEKKIDQNKKEDKKEDKKDININEEIKVIENNHEEKKIIENKKEEEEIIENKKEEDKNSNKKGLNKKIINKIREFNRIRNRKKTIASRKKEKNSTEENQQIKEKEKENEKIENENQKKTEIKNLLFRNFSSINKEIKIQDKKPFRPISPKNLNNSKNVREIEIDLSKLKRLEASNSVGEFKPVKNYKYYKQKNTIDKESEKLLKDIESEKIKLRENQPEDIVEHRKIDYRKDIIIEDPYLKSHQDLYDKMQKNLKQMIYRSHLPLFTPELYMIEHKIGEGTNGAIYQVINIKSKKKYAMKKLLADSLISLKYLIKEFDLIYDVVHPNILNIYGMNVKCFDENNFSLSVLMDLGETDWDMEINEHLNNNQYYTEEELISILKQLASALLYLQRDKKIAHRDIKPENVLIFENNIYKLGDFGEAKGTKSNNKLNTLRGTDIFFKS